MTPGQLDRRITIQQKTVTQDTDYGTEAITWSTFASRISAQVQDVAKKYFGDDQLTVGVLLPQPIDKTKKPRTPAIGSRH